jgi:sRNA-binding carbon storage regulator CsrA
MLRLWRNVGEGIRIGDDISLRLVANENGVAGDVEIMAPQLIGDEEPRLAHLKLGEPYRLTDAITFTLSEIERAGARFHFQAPREIEIWREEIYLEKQEERRYGKQKQTETRPRRR